jgi:hypothetical protein
MTTLAKIVEIDRRFARSARVDADLKGHPPLVGYVMQASVTKALTTMAASQIDSRQGAFTWTGPYGGGKSSAALLVANLIGGVGENRRIAREIVGEELVALYSQAFPEENGPWAVVPVTGSRLALREVIAIAARDALNWSKATFERATASDNDLVAALLKSAETARSGVLLILDELGKLLEHAVADANDIHLLQDLAERSARSEGRLVVIGILHQAFDQYAARASRDAREEWKKVQGRYQDLAILAGADETVALLARAVRCEARPESAVDHADRAAAAVAKRRPTEEALLADALAQTWPLNPITTLLLGPVSRQRFAQNERSVFGFLSSAEPAGFQEHLNATEQGGDRTTYDPDRLWDYLAANFSMALTGGADGARFSLAFEAIDRAAAKGGELHVALTKAAAAIEFFRNGSGLALADDFLALAAPYAEDAEVRSAIAELVEWAILMRQPRLGGYALFAGSDFDLEDAIGKVITSLDAEQLTTVPQRVGLGFATAKRHYFRTGALRTFEVMLVLVGEDDTGKGLAERVMARAAKGSGKLALLLSDGTLDPAGVEGKCKSLAKALKAAKAVAAVGAAANSYSLRPNAAELFAIERISREHPQLEGDRIARREIAARHSACLDAVKRDLEVALNGAKWWLAPKPKAHLVEPLSIIATALADEAYDEAPVLKSELLQRDKPSSNAMAAVRELCHAMVGQGDKVHLGFKGYPAGLGLYMTVLEPFGLHREGDAGFDFFEPDDSEAGKSLRPVWALLNEPAEFALGDIYREWAKPPIGLKGGLMPVLALANILARRDRLAVYVEDQFQTGLDDVFVDKLLQNPDQVRLRRIDRSAREANFLEGLAHRFGLPADGNSLPVAQALYQRFEALSIYAQRTETLSPLAQKVRGAVLKSKDPERMFFEALPEALDDSFTAEVVFNALVEAERAYPDLLEHLRQALATALGADVETFAGLSERAESVKGLTNDWAFEGFAMRAAAFEHGEGDIEGLASLLLHRSPRTWSDRDCEQALTELTSIGRRFREFEAVATVRQRPSNAEALALIVGLDHSTPPTLASFVLTDTERTAATGLADRLLEILGQDSGLQHVRLAALARAVADVAARTEAA